VMYQDIELKNNFNKYKNILFLKLAIEEIRQYDNNRVCREE